MRKSYLFLLSLLMPSLVWAHGQQFFEFSPDASSAVMLSTVATPGQVFIPQNDFLNGIDFWLANPAIAGPATFILFDKDNNQVFSKTVAVPIISRIDGGKRFHVDFPSQIAVNNKNKYTIKIISNLPELELYYSDRIKFLSHSAPFISEYLNGVALLGDEPQTYSFKFSLYESSEALSPIITNVGASIVSENQVKINFNASEPVDYKIDYGIHNQGFSQQTNFTSSFVVCTEGISFCSLTVSVLPNTIYDFRITVIDVWGNSSQVSGTFSSATVEVSISVTPTVPPSNVPTPTPADIQPPIISGLEKINLSDKSVDVIWSTNEAANSYLLISDVNLITIAAASDPAFEFEHFLSSGPTLSSDTFYTVKISTIDLANNATIASFSFKTPKKILVPSATPIASVPVIPPATTPAPLLITDLGNDQAPGNQNSLLIKWQSPTIEPKDGYRIDIINNRGMLVQQLLVPSGRHEVAVSGLPAGDNSVVVYANNNGVYQKVAKPGIINIKKPFLERVLNQLPYILGSLSAGIIAIILLLKFFGNKKIEPPVVTSSTTTSK